MRLPFLCPKIGFRRYWLLHDDGNCTHAANVLLLMPVPAAPHWHLKVSACGWLTDLCCNTGSTDTTPGPAASASLLRSHRLHQSSSPIIWFKNHQFGHIFSSFLFLAGQRKSFRGPVVALIREADRADFWKSVYFFSNWIGKAADSAECARRRACVC